MNLNVGRTLSHFATALALLFSGVFAFAGPSKTTYQAKIIKPDGYPLEASNVNFKFTILDPSATCILYTESYSSVNMSLTGGLISFSLGSGIKSYPASATTFEQIFSNIAPNMPCDTGGGPPADFTPLATDTRKIVMQFNDGLGWQTLPAMTINAVPYAMYANDSLKFNGLGISDFVQLSMIPSCGVSEALRYNGASFACVAVGSGGTSVTSGSVITALGYTPADGASVTALTSSLSSTDSNVSAVSSTVFSVSSTVATLNSTVSSLSTTLNTVSGSVAVVSTNLANLQGAVSAITSSQWVSSSTAISYTLGSVGIGTTDPAAALSVSGTTNFTVANIPLPAPGSNGSANGHVRTVDLSPSENYTTGLGGYQYAHGEKIAITISSATAATDLARLYFFGRQHVTTYAAAAPTTQVIGAHYTTSIASAGAVTNLARAMSANLRVSNSNAVNGNLNALGASVAINGTDGSAGSAADVTAVAASVFAAGGNAANTFAMTNAFGVRSSVGVMNTASSTITNAYGVYVDDGVNSGSNGGTLVNQYGLFIENQSLGTNLKYNIYSAGSSSKNYFEGAVVHGAGSATHAPIQLTSGLLLASPQSGAIEYDGSSFYLTDGTNTRRTISTVSASGTYDNMSMVTAPGNITLAPTGSVIVSSTTASTNAGTGALVVGGGLGVAENIYASGSITTSANIRGASLTATSQIITPIIYGGTGVMNNLRLESTTHATKGYILMAQGSSGGNVGIGTATPLAKLYVDSDGLSPNTPPAGTVAVFDNESSNMGISLMTGLNRKASMFFGYTASPQQGAINYHLSTTASLDKMTFDVNQQERMVLTASSTLGIGTSAPTAVVHAVNAIPTQDIAVLKAAPSQSAPWLRLLDSGNVQRASISPNGGMTQLQLGVTNAIYLTSEYGGVNEVPAGTLVNSNGNLSLMNSNGGAGYKVTTGYFNGTNFYSAWEIANVASGFGNLLLMKSGGNVGVGTSAPTAVLDVSKSGTSDPIARFGSPNPTDSVALSVGHGTSFASLAVAGTTNSFTPGSLIDDLIIRYPAGKKVLFSNGGLRTDMVIDGAGNVGIGTVSPTAKLDVSGTLTASQINITGVTGLGSARYSWAKAVSISNAQAVAGQKVLLTFPSGAQNTQVEISTTRTMTDMTAATQVKFQFIVTKGGQSIFVTAPEFNDNLSSFNWYFDSSTGTPYLRFSQSGNTYTYNIKTESSASGVPTAAVDAGTPPAFATVTPQYTLASGLNNDFSISTSGSQRLIVNGSGNVGIGTTSPSYKLQIQQTSSAPAVMISGANAGSPRLQTYGLDADPNAWMGLGTDMGGNIYEHSIYFPTGSSNNGRLTIGDYDGAAYNTRMTVLQNGNVGIGMTNPATKLQVSDIYTNTTDSASGMGLSIFGSANDYGGITLWDRDGNTATTNDADTTIYWGDDVGESLRFAFKLSGAAFSEKMRITAAGNVGIGVSAPTAALEVRSKVLVSNATNGSSTNVAALNSASSDGGYLHLRRDGTNEWYFQADPTANNAFHIRHGNLTSTPDLTILQSGFIGLGTSAPATKLNIGGLGAANATALRIDSQDTYSRDIFISEFNTTSYGGIVRYHSGLDLLSLITMEAGVEKYGVAVARATGYVGIGMNSAAAYPLDVNGDIRITGTPYRNGGDSAWIVPSDARLKDVSGDYNRGLREIANIDTIYFNYKKDNPKQIDSSVKYTGVLAQQVQKQIPEAVKEDKDGFLSLNTTPIFWAMLNAVKELYHQVLDIIKNDEAQDRAIASVKEENKIIKAENAKIKQENAEIKAYLCAKDPSAPLCK